MADFTSSLMSPMTPTTPSTPTNSALAFYEKFFANDELEERYGDVGYMT